VELAQPVHHLIQPGTCFRVVQSSHDDREFVLKVFVLVLEFAHVSGDVDVGMELSYEVSSHLSLGLADVSLAEEELPVEVGEFDGVHVHHFDFVEAQQSEILEQFASKASCSCYEHFGVL